MIKRNWIPLHYIRDKEKNLAIKQVYVWIITQDQKIVVVSKNGKNWQLPGGKPNNNESISQTALRETLEETSINLSNDIKNLKQFGYYVIEEENFKYIQLRTYINLVKNSEAITLSPQEDKSQANNEKIKFAEFVTKLGLLEKISWMETSGEYKTLIDLKLL